MNITINLILVLYAILKIVSSNGKLNLKYLTYECNQDVVNQLQSQGLTIQCDKDYNIIVDCKNEDISSIKLILKQQLMRGYIKFINVSDLHFDQISIENSLMYKDSIILPQQLIQIVAANLVEIESLFILFDEKIQIINIGDTYKLFDFFQVSTVSIKKIEAISLFQNVSNPTQIFLTIMAKAFVNIDSLIIKQIYSQHLFKMNIKSFGRLVINTIDIQYTNLKTDDLYPSVNISAQDISVNILDVNINEKKEQQNSISLINFSSYSNLLINKIDVISFKDYQGSLFYFCSENPSQQKSALYAVAVIKSIIIQSISLFSKTTSILDSQTQKIFDFSCNLPEKTSEDWNAQFLQIDSIEVLNFQAQNTLLMMIKNSYKIQINSLKLLESQNEKFNIWQQSEMFRFYPPINLKEEMDTSVNINNVEIYNLNFANNQYGIFYGDSLQYFTITNTTLTSSSTISSIYGSFISLTNTTFINIYNSTFKIENEGQIKTNFGGLIYILECSDVNISLMKFTRNNNDDDLKFQGIQGGLLYYYTEYKFNNLTITQIDISNIETSADGGFAYITSENTYLQNIKISQVITFKNGGAIFFGDQLGEFSLKNVEIRETIAQFAGGAFFGGRLINAENVVIEKCSAIFGGGFFMTKNVDNLLDKIKFNNDGFGLNLSGKDYCYKIDQIKIKEFGEFNQYLPEPLKMHSYPIIYEGELNQIKVTQIYNGLTYYATFSFKVNGVWYDQLPPQFVEVGFNDLTSQINGIDYMSLGVLSQSNPIPFEGSQFYFSLSFLVEGRSSPLGAVFSLFNTTQFIDNFSIVSQITSNCGQGMIQQTFKGTVYCSYCVDSVVNATTLPKIPTKCLPCPKAYFEECYAVVSDLKQGFWRETNTVDSDKIFPCSIRRLNCLGGNSIGNDLCVEGHIGVECLECDLYNEQGMGSFSRTNIYSCTKCDNISFNVIKIILLLCIIFIFILIIFKTNFRQQKNYIYKKYLSDMRIIYFGKSYYRLGQSGSYIRILTFYFQIVNISSYFYGQYTWKQFFSFQQGFYNPITNSSFSFDCFLLSIDSHKQSTIAYSKLSIITISPFVIVAISLIPSLLKLIFKKSTLKQFQYSASLVISYGFTALFCIPVIDVLVSGMLCRTFNNGQSYSIIDFNIECNDSNRLTFLFSFILPFILIYSIGIPGILLYQLVKNRKNHDKISCRFFLGYLYIDYKPQFFYWEYVRLLIKLILIISLYSFLSQTQLIGFVSIAVLMIYLIILVKKQPYVTKKLNNMEQKSVVTGCLFLIAFMINFSLEQQNLAQQINNNSDYNVFSTIVIITANILSLCFIAYMVYQITISILQPHLYKFQQNRIYLFIVRFLKILRFKKYTERKRLNIMKLRNLVFSVVNQGYFDKSLELQHLLQEKHLSEEEESITQTELQKNQITSD